MRRFDEITWIATTYKKILVHFHALVERFSADDSGLHELGISWQQPCENQVNLQFLGRDLRLLYDLVDTGGHDFIGRVTMCCVDTEGKRINDLEHVFIDAFGNIFLDRPLQRGLCFDNKNELQYIVAHLLSSALPNAKAKS